jgi:hypothetical protein
MDPTRTQRFWAGPWPARIWFVGWPVGSVAVVVDKGDPTFAAFTDIWFVLCFVFAVVLAVPVGFFLSLAVGFPVIGTIMMTRERINGGPFEIGDRVQIIAGRHAGTVTRVYSTWQCGTLRVELGEEASEDFKDIYGPAQLLRATESS